MTNKQASLNNVLQNKQIETFFQAIISLRNGGILGYEALNRAVSKEDFKHTKNMFAAAKEQNLLWDLELLCQTQALDAAQFPETLPQNKKIFLNVEPEVVKNKKFQESFSLDFLDSYNISTENIIFELSEEAIKEDEESFKAAAAHYKQHNFMLAIDDAGIGYSGLNLVEDVQPNYLKVSMKLVRDIDKDRIKMGLVKAMIEFAKASNVLLIAEGVETFEELNTLTKLGVHYAQGYFIQKPQPKIENIPKEIEQMVKRINLTINKIASQDIYHSSISELSTTTKAISPDLLIQEAYDMLNKKHQYDGLCVVENGVPIGILTKGKLASLLSGRYGYNLHQNKAVHTIMDRDFLVVDRHTPVNIAANLAMERTQNRLYDFIVVTDDNQYIGTVTIKSILQKGMEIEISSARSLSPLTGLPGNNAIEQKLKEMLSEYEKYSVAYIDIDYFKAYNDVYGFERGDRIIRLLANTLNDTLPENCFIGHIGGDDFIVIHPSHFPKSEYDYIVERFEAETRAFYNTKDLENGYILSESRTGVKREFPLATITVACLTNEEAQFKTTFEITEALAALKKQLRQNKVTN